MRLHSLAILKNKEQALKEHFEAREISVSEGIRMVLVQHMRSKGYGNPEYIGGQYGTMEGDNDR